MNKLGFGTWGLSKAQTKDSVRAALEAGYRHFDLAYICNNEKEAGNAISEWMNETKTKRQDLFITSKLWNTQHRPENVKPAILSCLDRLKLDYLDLFLIHWPYAFKPNETKPVLDSVTINETWKAMEKIQFEGLTKEIGVSNFCQKNLQNLMQFSEKKPFMNQIEIHPYLQQNDVQKMCLDLKINVTAYSPLGSKKLLSDPVIKEIADKYQASASQVLIAWNLSKGNYVIPRSSNKNHIIQNFQKINLDKKDVVKINNLECGIRIYDPRKMWNL